MKDSVGINLEDWIGIVSEFELESWRGGEKGVANLEKWELKFKMSVK